MRPKSVKRNKCTRERRNCAQSQCQLGLGFARSLSFWRHIARFRLRSNSYVGSQEVPLIRNRPDVILANGILT
jgi:hypothetical protein